ncbi:MAG TPA: NADH-quinone oxidoreductase subunit C, partial [Fibrobacteria bacterium]|nr:NADH-quinone oxidoreductase subunit C [Fibrobacteria bacterium]
MKASVIVETVDLATLPILDAGTWRKDLSACLREGMRVVSLFGKPSVGEDVILTAIVMGPDFKVHVSRARMDRQHGYHELTSDFPSLHAFERELHEQTGIRIAGHPWLKPIRYEGRDQAAMATYPYYRVEGKEVHEVAVGPIHAGIIEPGSFRFLCEGEKVHHLEIQLGYQHRGVEKRLLTGDPMRLAPLVETIAGDSSIAHAWAYCAAIESLAGCELDADTEAARAVVLELERVAMHLSGMAGLSTDLAFLQGASTYSRLRTIAINSAMQLCGSRLGRGAIRPGGI